MVEQACDVVVIGGGIIGRSVAAAVARRGATVTVVEPGGATFGTSVGNAGHLVPSHVVPFAAPGMVRAGLHSLMARNGAFAVSPRVVPGIGSWLWRFARSANEANVQRGVPVLRTLLDLTVQGVHRLIAHGASIDHEASGVLQLASSPASWGAVRHEMEGWARWGVRTHELDAQSVRAHEPALRTGVLGGVLLLDDARFDSALLHTAVADEGRRHGVADVAAAVRRIERVGGSVRVHTEAGLLRCGQVVVAAGVWTPRLLAPFGVKVPVRPARGDSVTLPNGPGVPRLRGAMMLVDQKVALSSLERGLRITGRFGLTSTSDRALHPGRARTLIRKAAGVLELDSTIEPQHMWTGLRPATPDGLPMLGRLDGAPEVVVAAGHGMLGSTTSLGTADVVAAIVNGDRPLVDLGVVSPMRFTRS